MLSARSAVMSASSYSGSGQTGPTGWMKVMCRV